MIIKELFAALVKLNYDISHLLSEACFSEYDDFSDVDFDDSDPEECLLHDELSAIMSQLVSISTTINYLKLPVTGEYILYRNADNRYECERHIFHCGDPIEICLYNELYDRYEWVISRIEANKDYYVVGHSGASLDGARVRFRG